jgi:flagellar hook-associated protein 2
MTPLAFTGISRFSNDLQTILARSVAIAQLPVQALQRDQISLSQNSMSLSKLREAALEFAAAARALGATSQARAMDVWSNSSKASASLTGAAAPATFTITEISSLARRAVSTSLSGYATVNATPVAGPGETLELAVGARTASLDLSGGRNTLEGVRDAINASGLEVTAAILNTGQGPNPYVLSLSAAGTGHNPIQLRTVPGDPASNILAATDPGADAVFRLNGQPITSPANDVEGVVEGVRFSLLALTAPGESATLTVRSNANAVVTAIQRFVTAYNGLASSLDAHIGEAGGALRGNRIVGGFQRLMRLPAGFSAAGSVRSLADLGLTFTREGVLEFDSSAVTRLDAGGLEDAFSLMGSSTAGFGDLATRLEQYTDPVMGAIQRELDSNREADLRISGQIARMNERIEAMRASLMARLQAADALLAQLEGQQGMLDATIESLTAVSFGQRRDR